jgi:hypothetical protein
VKTVVDSFGIALMAVTKRDKPGWHRDEIAPANLTALNLEGRFFIPSNR